MAKSKRVDKDVLKRLHNELRLSEKRNQAELLPIIQDNIARYTGRYIPSFGIDWDIVLNEVYPIVQFNLPSIFYKNPRAFLKPRTKTFIVNKRDPLTGEMVPVQMDSMKSARTQEHLLNYTVETIDYKQEARKVLFDALICPHGVLWHGYKGEFGMTEEQSISIQSEQVFVKRLSPLRFLFDPAVNISNLAEARWVARSFDIPLTDILEDDVLNVNFGEVKGKAGYGQSFLVDDKGEFVMKSGGEDKMPTTYRLKPLLEYADKSFQESRYSRFVTLYEVFLRPTKKEKRDGSKGQIILLTDEQFEDLRNSSWPYKAKGFPVEVLQFNELPDATFGLDDVTTYRDISDNKNIMRNLQIRNAQENSKVWVFMAKDGVNEEDIEKVKVGDQTIVLYDGDSIANKAQVSSAGLAASQELYLIDQRLDRELQDKSGVSDLKRGFLQSGEESASSVRLRAAGGSIRPQYRQDIMADFLKKSFKYINQLNKQFMPIKEAVRLMGTLDVVWSNNPTKEEIQAEVDVELDIFSMLPEDPKREIEELTVVLNLMQNALTNPGLFQKLQQEGKTFNLSPIIENLLLRLKLRDPEIFRQIGVQESMGYVSVAELRAAEQNVAAALQGQPPPSPPAPGQDHRARLELYQSIFSLLQALGQQSDVLAALIQQQQAIAQQEQNIKQPKTPRRMTEKV